MAELAGLSKLLRMGSGVKSFLDARRDLDKHHAALLMDDAYRTTYRVWWEVHLSVRQHPELMKEMTNDGRQIYQTFRKYHEQFVPRRHVSESQEAEMLAGLKRYDHLIGECDTDDPHGRLEAWNLSLDAPKEEAVE
ncbi:MAG TPA: hypothetical protein VMW58_06465 [Anaerolineae bacterium]|nr:hypothetical protein [Anaerolineae bacterium]